MRNRREFIVAFLGALWLGIAISAAASDKPKKFVPNRPIATDEELGFFGNSRDEFKARIKRVGLMPVEMPDWLGDRPDAEKSVRESVRGYLARAGFDVVGPETYVTALDRFNRQLGGMYDIATGRLKEDVAKAVRLNAAREFAEKDRLDAFVSLRIREQGADFFGDQARWANVVDKCEGGGQGSLPALSLLVQFATPQGNVKFGREGGIQLVSYDVPGQGFTVARVPAKDLLRDSVRIERAVRMATLPLFYSGKQIMYGYNDPDINPEKELGKLPDSPAAVKDVRPPPLRVPRDEILRTVKRVVIAPLQDRKLSTPDEVMTRLLGQVRQELAPLNWDIVESPQARAMLQSKSLEARLFDPYSGKFDEPRASQVRVAVFQAVGGANPPDAILWVKVVTTTAFQRNANAVWDGGNQNALTRKPVPPGVLTGIDWWTMTRGAGGIQASSVEVRLVDHADRLLYESRGGLELLQTLRTNYLAGGAIYLEPVDLAPAEFFRDGSREPPAIHAALRELVMTPEAALAETTPPPPKKSGYKIKVKKHPLPSSRT